MTTSVIKLLETPVLVYFQGQEMLRLTSKRDPLSLGSFDLDEKPVSFCVVVFLGSRQESEAVVITG